MAAVGPQNTQSGCWMASARTIWRTCSCGSSDSQYAGSAYRPRKTLSTGAGLHSPAYCLYVRVGGGNGAASLLPCNGEKSVQRMMRPHMPSVGGLGSRHLRIRDEPIPPGNPDDGGAYGGVQGIHSIAHRRRRPTFARHVPCPLIMYRVSRVMCCNPRASPQVSRLPSQDRISLPRYRASLIRHHITLRGATPPSSGTPVHYGVK